MFFFWNKNRVSQGLTEFIWDNSLLLLKLERYFWFLLTCVSERKKVWVNFKRKVLYFRSSNHTSGEIRPATKSDIEVKTVSVTSVVEWHKPERTNQMEKILNFQVPAEGLQLVILLTLTILLCLVLLCDQNSFGRSKMVLVWPNWFGLDHNDLVTTKINWSSPNCDFLPT